MLNNGRIARFQWLIPISVALSVYYVGLNNFFTWDDFIWLNKARTFKQDWLQIFRPEEANYFDPLVHLMFVADSMVGGFNQRWYHGVDLAIHAVNSLLLYRFARLLSDDDRTALYGGILFAGSFAVADAVLWSSSRVDLVSTLFSLGALIQFLHYLRSEKKGNLYFSFVLFLLALAAKGTPLVLPLILLWLIIQVKKPLNHAVSLIPFCVVAILYIALLKLATYQAALPLDRLHFNIGNIVLAFCTLFIPEGILDYLGLNIVAPLLFILISALGLSAILHNTTVTIRRTGYCILLTAILPVLITTDFKLVTSDSNFVNLLSSPSHRIYLASVGTALFGGGVLRSIEIRLTEFFPRFATLAVVMLLAAILISDAFLVRERDNLWESIGEAYSQEFHGILAFRGQIGEGSQIGAIKFTGSSGFLTPMIKVCLGVNDITFLNPVIIGMINDMEILGKAEKSFLFIHGRDGHVYNKSQAFRQQLLLNRMALLNPERPGYTSECQAVAAKLRWEINRIIE